MTCHEPHSAMLNVPEASRTVLWLSASRGGQHPVPGDHRGARTPWLSVAKDVVEPNPSLAALDAFDANAIDVVVTDIKLPAGEDHALALARMINKRRPRVPFILMTTYPIFPRLRSHGLAVCYATRWNSPNSAARSQRAKHKIASRLLSGHGAPQADVIFFVGCDNPATTRSRL
jgi:CheY-like chemotaxis protein